MTYEELKAEADTHNAAVAEYRAARAAQLAAMPRCEVTGCKSRATYRAGSEGTGICGRHLNRAQATAARAGVWGSGTNWTRATVLAAATRQRRTTTP